MPNKQFYEEFIVMYVVEPITKSWTLKGSECLYDLKFPGLSFLFRGFPFSPKGAFKKLINCTNRKTYEVYKYNTVTHPPRNATCREEATHNNIDACIQRCFLSTDLPSVHRALPPKRMA